MRLLITAFVATLANSAAAWEVKTIPNRLGDGPFRIVSTDLKVLDKPRSGLVLGTIAVDCDMVMLTFSDIVGGPKNAVVALRADRKPPLLGALQVTPNLRTALADEAQTKRVLSYLLGATLLYGEIQSSTIGLTSFEVPLAGLPKAMRAAGMKCAQK